MGLIRTGDKQYKPIKREPKVRVGALIPFQLRYVQKKGLPKSYVCLQFLFGAFCDKNSGLSDFEYED